MRITTDPLTGCQVLPEQAQSLTRKSLLYRLSKNLEIAEHKICYCEALDRKLHFLFWKAGLEPDMLPSYQGPVQTSTGHRDRRLVAFMERGQTL